MYLIDLTVEAYGEYLRALFFFGGGSLSEINDGNS